MTLKEWGAVVSSDLAQAGFDVGQYGEFPIVKRPASMEETVRLIKFRTVLPAEKRIYAEGMLFVPAGLPV